MPDRQRVPPPSSLFRQIATRLVLLTAIFAVLDAVIVVSMYAFDQQALAEDFIEQQANRVDRARRVAPSFAAAAPQLDGIKNPFGVDDWGFVVIDDRLRPIHRFSDGSGPTSPDWPSPTTLDWTRRERLDAGVQITGVRRFDSQAGPYWVLVHARVADATPFWPVIGQELVEHVALPLVPLTVLLLIFSVQVVRRTLSPLEKAASEVDALDPSRMEMRLSPPSAASEVSALVTAVNRALDRLQQAMTLLKSFTADAAHELRTPLSVLRLQIDALPDSPARARLGEDVQSMSRLVNQMLDLAQADALRMDQARDIDLATMAAGVIAQIAPHAFASNHDIELVDRGAAQVRGDPDALGRALRNLIENAIRHTEGGAPIEVIVGPGPQFSVRDRGTGVAPDDLPHVFDRFWRKSRSSDTGAGLGLGIVRSIVEAHDGIVSAQNALSGGAIFTCKFPEPNLEAD